MRPWTPSKVWITPNFKVSGCDVRPCPCGLFFCRLALRHTVFLSLALTLFLSGKRIHVQISKSRPRGPPEEEAYPPPPGRGGYYPPRYPGMGPEPPYRGRMSPYPPPPPPPPPPRRVAYPDHGYGERDGYGVVDYYEKFRARPIGNDDRRPIPPPPPPPSALVRERLGMGIIDPYERRPPPYAPPSYMARDRSPIRRAPPPPAPSAGNGFSYERSRLPPMSRAPMYAAPRPRDSFMERPPPPPPPQQPRYAGY